jgi:hypothetical protein
MSFCPQCGAGLEPDASFCATCGTPVGDRQAQAQAQAMPAAAPSLSGSVSSVDSAATASGASSANAAANANGPASATAPTPRRRKLSIPALVAIIVAVMIVAGVGGGVLYTNVIAPAITQQQFDSRLANLKAVYKDVLDDYESAQDDYSNSDTAYDQAAFAAKHTYVYKDRALDAKYMKKSKNSFEYSFVTLEGDDTPALLIRSSVDSSTGSSTSTSSDSATSAQKIVAIYVMVDGKPTLVADSSASGGTLTQVDGKYFNYSGTGTDASGKTCDYNLYFSLTDAVANASQNYTATDSGITVAGLSVPVADSKDIHPLAFSMKPQDGSGDTTYIHPDGTTNTAAAGADSQEETLRSECAKLFPDSDNNDSATTWQYISTEAAQQREELESKQAEVKAKYQVVLDDYNAAVTDYAAEGTSYDQTAFTSKHPYLYADRINDRGVLDATKGQFEYSFASLGDDETPALLVRYKSNSGNGSAGSSEESLIAVYKLIDDKPQIVVQRGHEHTVLSIIDGNYLSYFSMATVSGSPSEATVYFDLSGRTTEEVSDSQNTGANSIGTNYIGTHGISFLTSAPDCIHVLAAYSLPLGGASSPITVIHANGPESSVGRNEANNVSNQLKQECSALYGGATELNWKSTTVAIND